MRVLKFLAPFGAAAVLVAAGCTSGSGEREPTAVEAAIIDRLGEGPSEESTPAETEAARSELVAACMAEDDLEYLGPPEAPSLIEWLGLTAEEFEAQYGFGHTTTIDLRMAYEVFANGVMEDLRAEIEALPAADRERYRPRELECLQESYAEFGFPVNGSVYLPNDSPIHEYTARATEATVDDPRLAEVTRAWSNCMAEQGYDFEDRDEMGLPLQEDAEPFIAAYASQGQALVEAGRTWDDLRTADVFDAEQLAALEELQQRELAISAAHRGCIDQGHDIDAVYTEVYDEYLAEFTASLRATFLPVACRCSADVPPRLRPFQPKELVDTR
jgi:hypothetical protein